MFLTDNKRKKSHPVGKSNLEISWDGEIDPEDWRNMPNPDSELENDEYEPTPQWVIDVLGFDSSEEDRKLHEQGR